MPYRLLVEEAGRSRAWLMVDRKTGGFETSRFDAGRMFPHDVEGFENGTQPELNTGLGYSGEFIENAGIMMGLGVMMELNVMLASGERRALPLKPTKQGCFLFSRSGTNPRVLWRGCE